ncbi:MAG: DNA repair protein RecN [Chloroflexi bacterium]|nr:DNA repair protein RecN [Chloroflexota bacterium]
MLEELSISNFAIIDNLQLTFAPGFNVLTGETGAGKSIIIDAVSMLLGGRADSTFIRSGTEGARIEGVFRLPEAVRREIGPLLSEGGLEGEDDTLILAREIKASGRNICRVNNRPVTLSFLEQIGQRLVDIHGQSEHLSLLRVRNHLIFLDRYAGLEEQRAELATVVQALRAVREELHGLIRDERELARRVDLLEFQVKEIESARLDPNEEEEIARERNLLVNAEKLAGLCADAYRRLNEGEEEQLSIIDNLAEVIRDIGALEKLDPTRASYRATAEEALYQLEELARSLRDYQESIEFDPHRLRQLEERLDLLYNLKRKYGDSVAEVIAYGQRARAELEAITHHEERIAELREKETHLLNQIAVLGQALSKARREAAAELEAAVERELGDLNMARAQFKVSIEWVEAPDGVAIGGKTYRFDATGLDHVEFLISPNVGEPPKPLVKIASGGETSRLMLAMKTVLCRADQVPTLIFDEIDQGIGGRTGSVVGRKLWNLTEGHQVFCVTHLPQLAAYGDVHFRIYKQVVGERTVTLVDILDDEARISELGAMLGGPDSEATRRSAAELYEEGKRFRPQRASVHQE